MPPARGGRGRLDVQRRARPGRHPPRPQALARLVVDSEHGRRAIEIEFAPKGTPRLRRIVRAFAHSPYVEVVFLARTGPLLRTLDDLARDERVDPLFGPHPTLTATAWDALDDAALAEFARRIPAPPPLAPAPPALEPKPPASRPRPAPIPSTSERDVDRSLELVQPLSPAQDEQRPRRRWLRRRPGS